MCRRSPNKAEALVGRKWGEGSKRECDGNSTGRELEMLGRQEGIILPEDTA